MKYLIACLGNIGAEYAETRHNIGFKIADALAEASASAFKPVRYGEMAHIKHKGRLLLVLKPNTYMNLSGKAVRYWVQQEKILPGHLLVVTDDTALPFGKQRLRAKGSDGGHNGLKSINQLLGSQEYARLRIGIGNDFPPGGLVQYVLGEWSPEERDLLPKRIETAVETIFAMASAGIATAMTTYNSR